MVSTSIPGLAAKPIIDLDVVINDMALFPSIIECLDRAGFEYEGDLGVEGREASRRRYDDGFMPYHLYVCPKDGKGDLEYITFRDYLRSHPDAVREYEKIKKESAHQYPHDIDRYQNGKKDFIDMVLAKTWYQDYIRYPFFSGISAHRESLNNPSRRSTIRTLRFW
ncbi:MAG: GrpB family protein [Methanospirillum sp.]|nr:GrpB family protein [Methanospirillum sp.]